MDIARIYGEQYGPEAGPWNLSLESKYLEYAITRFFEENFPLEEGARACNVGVGAGYWDRYLSYRPEISALTSVDIDPEICENFLACLENEGNPNHITVLQRDVLDCGELRGQFDLVTLVGSTLKESAQTEGVLRQAFAFLKPGGQLYCQSVYETDGGKAALERLCAENSMRVERYETETRYGRTISFWKLVKNG